jgi:hypothetical protein
MPLESHPLSAGDSSSASRGTRHRYGRNAESESSRPLTSYFDLKSQSDEREAQSLAINNKVNIREEVTEGDATVKPPARRSHSNTVTGLVKPPDGTASQQARPSLALKGIQRQSFYSGPQSQTTPGATPRAKHSGLPSESDGVLSDTSATLVLSTNWHSITDNDILGKLAKMEGSTSGPQHQHSACLSTIRLLSRQLSLVNEAHKKSEQTIQDQSRRYRKVANMMETSSQTDIVVIRKILDILTKDDVDELPVRGPQLVCERKIKSLLKLSLCILQTVSDSLTEAIAEAFTPMPNETFTVPSPRINTNDDAISIASSSRITDKDLNERGSIRSRGSGRSRDRASRPMSTVGEWMGSWWRDANKSSTSFDSSPSNQERPTSPGGEDTERDSKAKKDPQRRKTLNPFSMPSWMSSSAKPEISEPTPPSPERRRPPRKLSVVVVPSAASDGSPTSSRIQPTPTSALIPTIAPQIPTPPDGSPALSSRVSVVTGVTKEEHYSTLPSGPHPSHIRAISYATRVMSSDPHSIMVDAGVSPFIAQLGQALVLNLKDNTSFILRDGRIGTKSSNQRPPQTPVASDVPLPASAVIHMESSETRATLVSNLSKTLNKSMLVGVGRRPNPAAIIAAPILSTFKSRTASNTHSSKPSTSDLNVQKAPVVVNGVAPKAGTVEMDSIIPEEARPPTLYLSKKYTSSIADPSFRPSTFSTVPSRFSLKSNKIADLQTDRFGFIYDASVYDVNLLAKARGFNNSAPACLTGVRISDREAEVEDEEWWPSYEGELPPSQRKSQLKIMPEPCSCQDGILKTDKEPKEETPKVERSEPSEAPPQDSVTDETNSDSRPSENSVDQPNADAEAKSPQDDTSIVIPNHVCSNTVRVLLQELTKIHDHKEETYQVGWDALVRRIRGKRDPSSMQGTAQAVFAQASSGAAAFLGLGTSNDDDQEEDEETSWSAGLGFVRVRTNKDEWKDIMKLIRAGIPLTHRAKVWFECSGGIELSEPGTFRDLATEASRIHKEMKNGQGKHVAMEEIEKDVTRTMPLNVFFGGDGQGVDKLRSVLGAYSL